MDRGLAAMIVAFTLVLTAGCGPLGQRVPASQGSPASQIANSLQYPGTGAAATRPRAAVVARPLSITASVPLTAQATPAPAAAAPPAEIQDVVFATARNGWLVTSGVQGDSPTGGDGAIYRTTDGGKTWTQVWRAGQTSLTRLGLLAAPGHLWASGIAFSEQHPAGTPLWLTSSDGGATWTATQPSIPPPAHPTTAPLPPPVWPSLQFHFVTPQVGLATPDPEDDFGPSPPGVIWRTTDGGRAWQVLPLPKGLVSSGGLDFLNAQDGWITGRAPGTCDQLWHTTDGGLSWQPAAGTCPHFGLYAVHFIDPEHGFASGGAIPFIGAQAGILATDDGGATWHTVYHTQGTSSTGPITHLGFSSPTQGWAWGGMCKMGQNGPCLGAVLVTHDGGKTWSVTKQKALHLSAAGGQAWTTDGPLTNLGAAIGHTTDGGGHWTETSQPPAYSLCCLRPAPGRPGSVQIWQLSPPDGMPGPTYTNRQGSTAWTRAPADPFAASEGSFLWRASSNLLFRDLRGAFQVSRDGGRSWQPSPLPQGSFNVANVAFTSSEDGWAITQVVPCLGIDCAALDRTKDAGRTWTLAAHLPIGALGATLTFAGRVGVVVGSGTGTSVAVTTDGGAQWTVSPLPAHVQCGAALAGTSIWLPCQTAAYSGLLLYSADGGATWTEQTSRTVVPTAIAMTDATHGWMLAAGQGPTALSLYRTTDAGAHWTQAWPGLPSG